MKTLIVIASCEVNSQEYYSFPNGALVANGTINHSNNTKPYGEHIETVISGVKVFNANKVQFFGADKDKYSASALRAIANALTELADLAEESHKKLIELNKTN